MNRETKYFKLGKEIPLDECEEVEIEICTGSDIAKVISIKK